MNPKNKWNEIKRYYQQQNRWILTSPKNEWAIDPYLWDCGRQMIFMTPIELNFWADCRNENLVLYPQYPACGYFMDFANPVAKVGIECDGQMYHTDTEADAYRQHTLENEGWTIYRITGRECNEDWREEYDEESDRDLCIAPAGVNLAKRIGQEHSIKRMAGKSQGARRVGDFADEWIAHLIEHFSRGAA
jgi:very-short-patch-repair endonuclease